MIYCFILIAQEKQNPYDINGLSTSVTSTLPIPINLSDAGNEWESVGPFGGDVFDIAIDPTNTDLVFLAAGTPFKRDNAMVSWEIIDGLLALSPSGIHCIETNDEGVIYAGGNYTYGKIFMSDDQGVSWQQKLLLSGNGVLNISLDPSNQDIIYVTTTTNISGTTNKVIIKSDDAGESWSSMDMTTYFPIGMACNDIAVDPDNSDILVALGDGGFSFPPKAIVTLDGGTSWQDITSGLPSGKPLNKVLIHNGLVYICGGQLFGGNTMGIYVSDDYGSSWQDISVGFPIKVVNDILIDSDDENLMYAATEGDGVYYSTDGGNSWTYNTGGAGNNGSCRKIIFEPGNNSSIYAGFLSLGVCITDNSGEDWISSSVGIASLKLNDIEVDPGNPEIIFATFEAENSGGAYIFNPEAGDWGLVSSLPATRFSAVAIGTDGRMYTYSNGPTTVAAEGVYRSSDGGASWENMGPNIGPVFETQIYSIALSPNDPDLIFIAGNNFGANGWASMIYRSADAGENWENVFMGPDNDGFKYVYIDPTSDDQVVYAAYKSESPGAGFIKSIDGGENWAPINTGISSSTKWGGSIICDPSNPDVLYGGAGGYGGTPGTIYKSENGGSSWTATNISLGNNYSKINDMLISPLDPNVIYAATSINGVYMTEDGENWLPAADGLAATNITGLSSLFENEEEKLGFYASSFSNSAFYTELYEPGAIGINDIRAENTLTLWPNPAANNVWISTGNNDVFIIEISLFSMDGKHLFYSKASSNGVKEMNFSVSQFPAGVYHVSIKTTTGTESKKLVILE